MSSDRPQPLSNVIREQMRSQARSNTSPEMDLRRNLFARGLRYRVGLKVPGNRRRTIDIAFTRAKVAVFVDGCFWHRCPQHSVPVKNNADWWTSKLDANVRRDRETDQMLLADGWRVLRFWEHEDPQAAAALVARAVRQVEGRAHTGSNETGASDARDPGQGD